jgi:sterol desaturase/sphingolipid hydroxylase (fatty acid hydroxylase superfamily)
VLFLLVDLAFYCWHRAAHRVRWFWCAHVTHHSSERMNFSTAMRQNATVVFNGTWLFYLPLAFLGFNPGWIGACAALSLVYQFFIHSTLVPKLHPLIEFILNTPSHHRAHHGRNPRYIDRNFGGVFIFWDRLLNTFVEESAAEPVEYGIIRQIYTRNIFVSWLHEYRDMLRDVLQPGPWSQRLKHLWKPPEWSRAAETVSIA